MRTIVDILMQAARELDQIHKTGLAQQVHEVARRDWAVRVLDAARRDGWTVSERLSPHDGEGGVSRHGFGCVVIDPFRTFGSSKREFRATTDEPGITESDARLAAAEAAWPHLPENERARIGECP